MPTPAFTPTPSIAPDVRPEEATEAVIGDRAITLELATTSEERQRGLSNRTSLHPDAGMLFVFEEERELSFWMKDTLIPLDILFIDGEQRIVDIQIMVPEPGVPTRNLTVYPSAEPAMYALEVNAGVASELGLTVGMLVTFR